jgi:hypothetical protein
MVISVSVTQLVPQPPQPSLVLTSNRPDEQHAHTHCFTDMAPQKEAEQPLLGSAEEKKREEVRVVKVW